MANTAQARKRARQSEKRREHNAAQRSELRSAIGEVRKAIATGNKTAAQTQFRLSQSVIDSITDKKIFHKNAAARYKKQLAAAIKSMS